MMLLTFAIIVIGLATLALAMERHGEHLPATLSGRHAAWVLRVLGCSALVCALVLLLLVTDGIPAALIWLGFLAPGTLCIAFGMTIANLIHSRR